MFVKKKETNFPAWLFVLLSLVFDELLFQFWTGASWTAARLLTMLLFTAAFGLLLGLLSSFGSARVCRITAVVLSTLFAAFYFAEYLMHDAYGGEGGYMSLGIIFGTAAAAGNDFGDVIVSAVLHELWRFGILVLPIIVWEIFAVRNNWGKAKNWKLRGVLALACLVCFGLGVVTATHFPDREKYGSQFDFVEAVNTFGLLTALRLDLQNAERDLDFAMETQTQAAPIPTLETTAPTETEAAPEPSLETETEPEETEPEDDGLMHPEKPYNALDLDFAALAESASNSEIAKLNSYVGSLTPSSTNGCTGLFAGKNLIFITAEAFSLEVIDPELTPALYRMQQNGIRFTDYYQPAWGGSTSTGEYSLLTGLVPVSASAMSESSSKSMYYSLAHRLGEEGYSCMAFHNGTYDYYHRNKSHPNLGYETWMAFGTGMEAGVAPTWPESDQEMIDFTMPLFLDQQPFHVYYMSISGHGLYGQGSNFMSKKNYAALADTDWSEPVKCYLAANLEFEYAMEDLLAGLEEKGILDDTVIVIGTDHYPYCLEKSTTWHNSQDYLSELYGYPVTNCCERDHSALLLWSGCLETKGLELQVDTPTYSLDVLPTLLNLFGIEYDSRLLVGRDVFSDQEPLVLWNNRSWKTDKGFFNAANNQFTPADGVTVDDDYVKRISDIVNNKISFSKGVLKRDYYKFLFDE